MIDPDFILLDLRSQWDAFVDYADGWTLREVLTWLARYGEVTTIQLMYNQAFTLYSECGIVSVLMLDEEKNQLRPQFPTSRPLKLGSSKD